MLAPSIVVIGHNGDHYLHKCLESIFNQNNTQFEVIYVDNASTDRSLRIARQYPLRTIELNRNIGYTGGCNTAIQYCKSDFILFMNQDIIAAHNLLEELLKSMKDTNTAIVYPHISDYRKYPKISIPTSPLHFLPSIGALMFGEPSDEPTTVGFATGTAFMIRRRILSDLDYLFDSRLFMYYEDVDLSIRVVARGYNIIWVPTTCVWHRTENPSLEALFLSMRNIHLIIYKNFGQLYYLRTLPWIIYQHIFIMRHFQKQHSIPIRTTLPIFIRAYFKAARMLRSFHNKSFVEAAISAYRNICPDKQAKELLKDFQRRIILYG